MKFDGLHLPVGQNGYERAGGQLCAAPPKRCPRYAEAGNSGCDGTLVCGDLEPSVDPDRRHSPVLLKRPASPDACGPDNCRMAHEVGRTFWHPYTSPGRVTVIALQQGEELVTVSAGDTVRWIVGDTASGAGTSLRVNILVKPTRIGLKTNLVITTNRRTYLLELSSTPRAWMASASWDYPKDRMLALQKQAQQAQASAPVGSGLSLEQIKFRYAITGDSPPWKPLRAFDNGERVYIQFPADIAQGELPPLFVIGAQGDGQLVNYRFRSPYYVVDRLFGAAELRLGADKAAVVRIERTDGVSSTARRH